MSNQPNPTADNGRRQIVVAPHMTNTGVTLAKFLFTWLASALINVAMLGCLFVVLTILNRAMANDGSPVEVQEVTEVEDQEKDPDLSNTDLGLDDKLTTQYNLDRLDEVSVPGKVDASAAVGIENAPPDAAPMSLPPPPGTGGGTGGALKMPDAGTGSMAGTLGGMGGIYSPGGFGGRSGATREKLLQEGGGNALSEACVARGLKFLALHQAPDGHWGLHDFNRHARTAPYPAGKLKPDNSQPGTNRKNDVAGTAFGLLPFLAAGQTHKSPRKAQQVDYSKGIKAALFWLIARQSKSGGDRGSYGGGMYAHGLATIAMCEAYGLTSDPTLKASAQSAINFIAAAQDPAGGGWRYSPRTAGDTSVTGWQVMALKSGQMSGLTVPRAVLRKVEKYLDSCEVNKGNSSIASSGAYSYMPGGPDTPTMSSVGLLCRQYGGVNPRNPGLLAGVKRLQASPPGKTGNLYYEYYATQVMHHMGGPAWQFWNTGVNEKGEKVHAGIRDSLIAQQDKGTTGNRQGQAGSWPGNEHVGGRMGGTSLSLLTLEVYYRHLPLYRRDLGVIKKDE
jgi:hypothetical protein